MADEVREEPVAEPDGIDEDFMRGFDKTPDESEALDAHDLAVEAELAAKAEREKQDAGNPQLAEEDQKDDEAEAEEAEVDAAAGEAEAEPEEPEQPEEPEADAADEVPPWFAKFAEQSGADAVAAREETARTVSEAVAKVREEMAAFRSEFGARVPEPVPEPEPVVLDDDTEAALKSMEEVDPEGGRALRTGFVKQAEKLRDIERRMESLAAPQNASGGDESPPPAQPAAADPIPQPQPSADMAAYVQAETGKVLEVHPDMREIGADPKFTEWIGRQDDALKALRGSPHSVEVIRLLDAYKGDLDKAAKAAKAAKAKLALSKGVKSRTAPKTDWTGAEGRDDDFMRGFNTPMEVV